jgi:hypothetical protein
LKVNVVYWYGKCERYMYFKRGEGNIGMENVKGTCIFQEENVRMISA